MFDKKDYKAAYEEAKIKCDELRDDLATAEKNHDWDLLDLKKENELAAKDFKFQLDHLESEELKKKDAQNIELTKKLAVAEEKISMLDKIVDLNADVIDVKKLVTDLIGKLPSVNISSIAVTNPQSSK